MNPYNTITKKVLFIIVFSALMLSVNGYTSAQNSLLLNNSSFDTDLDDKISFHPLDYIYALELSILSRYKTSDFQSFIKEISNDFSFRDFNSFGIVFQQKEILFSKIDFQEKFFLLLNSGVGYEFRTKVKLYENLYFSFYPAGEISSFWLSTGIKKFSSTMNTASLGGNFEIMPRRYLSFSGRWIPAYQIRYLKKNGDLKTFNGKGWQFGIKFVFSHNIIRRFNFCGVNIDLEKIPFKFTYSRIVDQYTKQIIMTKMFHLIYLI